MSNLIKINLNLPVDIHEKLKKYKKTTGIDVSNYCRSAIFKQAKEDQII